MSIVVAIVVVAGALVYCLRGAVSLGSDDPDERLDLRRGRDGAVVAIFAVTLVVGVLALLAWRVDVGNVIH